MIYLFNAKNVRSDDDTHDEEHDEHSCHYGYIPEVGFPVVENECAPVITTVDGVTSYASYKFECNCCASGGTIERYSNSNCSGNSDSATTFYNQNYFDCSTESVCDTFKITRTQYTNDSTGSECDSNDNSIEISLYMTSGSTCYESDKTESGFGDDGNFYSISNISDGSFTRIKYTNSNCTTVNTSLTFVDGCTDNDGLSVGTYVNWLIELESETAGDDDEDDDDDSSSSSSGSSIYTHNIVVVLMLFVGLVVYF